MDRQVTTFEARCGSCGLTFAHPWLGDMAYGDGLLCSEDGRSWVRVDLFSGFGKRFAEMSKDERLSDWFDARPGIFWPALAALAVRYDDVPYTIKIVCPHCRSAKLERWAGKSVGSRFVSEARFPDQLLSDDEHLIAEIFALDIDLD